MTIWWSQYMFFSSGTCLFLLLHACWVASLRSSSSVSSSAHASRAFDTRPWETSFAFVVTRRSYLAIGLWRLGDERAYILWRQWPMYGWSLLLAESSLACFVRIFSTKGHVLSSPHMLDKKTFLAKKESVTVNGRYRSWGRASGQRKKNRGDFSLFPHLKISHLFTLGQGHKRGRMRCETSFPGLSPSFILFSTYFLLSYLLFPSSSLLWYIIFCVRGKEKGAPAMMVICPWWPMSRRRIRQIWQKMLYYYRFIQGNTVLQKQ